MATSNYAQYVLDEAGRPAADNRLTLPDKITVEIYKNWVDVKDPTNWTSEESTGFIKPLVLRIHSGKIRYKRVEISSVRGPHDGIYVVAFDPEHGGIVGCGVERGVEREHDVPMVPRECLEWFYDQLKEKRNPFDDVPECFVHALERLRLGIALS